MAEEKTRGGELTADQFHLLLAATRLYDAQLIHFSGGGEPLLNPWLSKALPWIAQMDQVIKVALSTNGILLTPEIAQHVDYLRVSIDAGTREHYERVSGVDAFDKVVANLKAIKPKGDLGLAMLVTDDQTVDWWGEISRFCNVARAVSADFMHVRPAWYPDLNRTFEAQRLTPYMDLDCKGPLHIRGDKFYKGYTRCVATPLQVTVTARGEYALCQDRPDLTFGRLEDGFEKAWFGEEHRNLLKMNFPDEDCPRCVMGPYHEIIERCFMKDELRMALV